jgi:hypothetical protein
LQVDKASAKVKEAVKSVPKALLPEFMALPEKYDDIKAALCEVDVSAICSALLRTQRYSVHELVQAELKMMTFDAGDLKLYQAIEEKHARISAELETLSDAAKRLNSEVESKTVRVCTVMISY